MKLIPLTQGRNAIVDDADYEWLRQWKWTLMSKTGRRIGYAYRQQVDPDGVKRNVLMHRAILEFLGYLNGPGAITDHVNGNGLDNRRANLRACRPQDNGANRCKSSRPSSSAFKGVSWHAKTGRWQAKIRVNKRLLTLGHYADELVAAVAYNEAARDYFGEFALLNQIPSSEGR